MLKFKQNKDEACHMSRCHARPRDTAFEIAIAALNGGFMLWINKLR